MITVLVRVLQKKPRTNRISNKGIYHKEFAHMVEEAEKAPRSAVGRPDNQISQWWKFQSECGITRKIKKKKTLQRVEGKQNCLVWEQNPLVQHCFVLFRLLLVGRSPLTLGKAICFTHSIHTNINLVQKHPPRLNTLTDTPKTVFKYLLTTWPP